MSETEKRERLRYKQTRKRRIILQAIVIAILLLSFAISGVLYYQLNKTYYIEYSEKGRVDYSVKYFESEDYDEWQKSGKSYISELTDELLVKFDYDMNMDAADVAYDYSYKIDTQLEIYDTKNKLPLYNPKEDIVPDVTGTVNSASELKIRESVNVDFDYYNREALEFIKKYKLSDVKSTLIVTMHVSVVGNCDELEAKAENEYSISLAIPLALTTFTTSYYEGTGAGESKVLACKSAFDIGVFRNTAIVSLILAVVFSLVLLVFVFATRNDDINYTIKVKRLLSGYRSFIQQITNVFDETGYQLLLVGSFGEMLSIRDTIQSPILMSENEDKTCTKFLIPTNTKILYVFEIKVDNYDEIYGKEEKEPISSTEEPEPQLPSEEPKEEPVEKAPAPAEIVEKTATEVVEKAAPAKTEREVPVTITYTEGEDGEDGVRLVDGKVVHIRYRTSFTSRLIRAEEKIQSLYTELKNELLAYKEIKARTSWTFESFNKGRLQLAKLNVKGAAVQLYLALNPDDYSEDKYHQTNVSEKPKLDKVPMMIKVKGAKGLRNALELIGELMKSFGIERGEKPNDDYRMPCESTEALVDRGLVKVIFPDGIKIDENTVVEKMNVGEHLKSVKLNAPAEEAEKEPVLLAEEPIVEEIVSPIELPAADDAEDGVRLVDGKVVHIRYRTSFTSRLIRAEEKIQSLYTELKNELLSYKEIKARTSWTFESFNKGRLQLAKLNIKGAAVQLYLALEPKEYSEDKYHQTDVREKPKLDRVPMMIKVKGAKGLRNALELIGELMKSLGIERGEKPNDDYRMPCESTEALVDRGLVKVIFPDGIKIDENTVIEKMNVGEHLKAFKD